MKNLSLKNVCKTYDNNNPFINHFDLEIHSGEIFGLIGHNGSGKSTLLKMMATLTIPNSGSIYYDTIDVIKHPQSARRKLGVFLEPERSLYWRLTGYENLERDAKLKGIPIWEFKNQAEDYLKKLGLYEHKDKPVSQYSKGMKVKLNLISAVIGSPEILLFDEPLAGLDYLSKLAVTDLITSLAGPEKIIVVCSNNLPEAQRLCNRILLMKGGRKLAEGAPSELLKDLPGEGIIEIGTCHPAEMRQWLTKQISPVQLSDDGGKIVVVVEDLIQSMTLIKSGIQIPYISILYREKDLTDYFILKNHEDMSDAGEY